MSWSVRFPINPRARPPPSSQLLDKFSARFDASFPTDLKITGLDSSNPTVETHVSRISGLISSVNFGSPTPARN